MDERKNEEEVGRKEKRTEEGAEEEEEIRKVRTNQLKQEERSIGGKTNETEMRE